MSRELRDALLTQRRVAEAIITVVNDTPAGAPADRLYAALRDHLSRDDFDAMMRALTAAKRVNRRGDRYYPVAGIAASQ